MQSPDLTIGGALEIGRLRLSDVSSTPWLDARILASHVTGLDASAVIAYDECRLSQKQRRQLFALLDRRAAGEPIAYLVGVKEFCGLRLAVNQHVLVPREETETLVMAVADDWRGQSIDVLDLGTGCGAIACAIAHLLPRARVLGTDVSDQALDVARHNVASLGLGDRVAVCHADLFDGVGASRKFDAIAANLPYVGEEDTAMLERGVSEHEPSRALFAGADGLDIYRRMFVEARGFLRPGAAVYCECSPLNAEELGVLARASFPTAEVAIKTDLSGLKRVVIVRTENSAA
ncbi:MAG: peptide chain release factor N(5)-glutamine methyltransferase, partial [Candidatus Eremiobacteraeota bacterium]|nr:peptide chain release factor N(5)-glutamine methyltransferase [Candidatus Eremiobacteraeota bacterium]